VKRPSIRHDFRTVTLRVEGMARADAVESAVADFRERTGYELRLEWV
jgi:hypothetical protein